MSKFDPTRDAHRAAHKLRYHGEGAGCLLALLALLLALVDLTCGGAK